MIKDQVQVYTHSRNRTTLDVFWSELTVAAVDKKKPDDDDDHEDHHNDRRIRFRPFLPPKGKAIWSRRNSEAGNRFYGVPPQLEHELIWFNLKHWAQETRGTKIL